LGGGGVWDNRKGNVSVFGGVKRETDEGTGGAQAGGDGFPTKKLRYIKKGAEDGNGHAIIEKASGQ